MTVRIGLELSDEQLTEIAERVRELNDGDNNGSPWLDVGGASKHLACGKDRIYSLVNAKRIPVHRDGRRLLFDRSELDAFVRRGGAKRP